MCTCYLLSRSLQEIFRKNLTPVHITNYSDEEIICLTENDIQLHEDSDSNLNLSPITTISNRASRNVQQNAEGLGPFNEVNLPGVWFYKIPHKVCE